MEFIKNGLSPSSGVYLGWWLMYLLNVIQYKIFYRENPFSILPSLVGMNGYLAYRVNDYYILDE